MQALKTFALPAERVPEFNQKPNTEWLLSEYITNVATGGSWSFEPVASFGNTYGFQFETATPGQDATTKLKYLGNQAARDFIGILTIDIVYTTSAGGKSKVTAYFIIDTKPTLVAGVPTSFQTQVYTPLRIELPQFFTVGSTKYSWSYQLDSPFSDLAPQSNIRVKANTTNSKYELTTVGTGNGNIIPDDYTKAASTGGRLNITIMATTTYQLGATVENGAAVKVSLLIAVAPAAPVYNVNYPAASKPQVGYVGTPWVWTFGANLFIDPDPASGFVVSYPSVTWSTGGGTGATYDPMTRTVTWNVPVEGNWKITVTATNGQPNVVPNTYAFDVQIAPKIIRLPVCDFRGVTALYYQTTTPFSFDYSTVCTDPDDTIIFVSGLSLVPNPTAPISLQLVGTKLQSPSLNINEAKASPIEISVLIKDKDNNNGPVPKFKLYVNAPPEVVGAAAQPTLSYRGGVTVTPVKFSDWFTDVNTWQNLTFTLKTTPVFTGSQGLKFDAVAGTLLGTPNEVDETNLQYAMEVTANDGNNGTAKHSFTVSIALGNKPPTTKPIPAQFANLTKYFSIRLSDFFNDTGTLTYNVSGLASGTGLILNPNGVLDGTITPEDFKTKNATVIVCATDIEKLSTCNNFTLVVVDVPVVSSSFTSVVAVQKAYASVAYSFNFSQYFASTSNEVITYEILAGGVSLMDLKSYGCDFNSGLLTCTPTQAMVDASLVSGGAIKLNVGVKSASGGSQVVTFQLPVTAPQIAAPVILSPDQTPCYVGNDCGTLINASRLLNLPATEKIESCTVITSSQPWNASVPGLNFNPLTGDVYGKIDPSLCPASFPSCALQGTPINVTCVIVSPPVGVPTKSYLQTIAASIKPLTTYTPPTWSDGLKYPAPLLSVNQQSFCGVLKLTTSLTGQPGLNLGPNGGLNLVKPGAGTGFWKIASINPIGSAVLNISNDGLVTGTVTDTAIIMVDYDEPSPKPPAGGATNLGARPVTIAVTKVGAKPTLKSSATWSSVYSVEQNKPLPANIADIASMFDGNAIVWSSNVNSATSGLSFSPQGRFTGQPSTLGTLNIQITANNTDSCNSGGVESRVLSLQVIPKNECPVANAQPPSALLCEGQAWSNFTSLGLFTDPNGDALNVSMSGLPSDLGLTFAGGKLSGTPNSKATDLKTLKLVFQATDGKADCSVPATVTYVLNFERGKRPPIADPPIPSPVTAMEGDRFIGYFNFHFREVMGEPLIYSVAGLPPGSGLGIGPVTGIFTGAPNQADLRASPLVLSVFASNEHNAVDPTDHCAGKGGRARADFILVIKERVQPPVCGPIPSATVPGQVGQFWMKNVGRFFSSPSNKRLEYGLRGLPRGSGLTVEPNTGAISGVLTEADAHASPLNIVIAVSDGQDQCQSSFMLQVVNTQVQPTPGLPTPISPTPRGAMGPCPIAARDIPTQTALANSGFSLDLSSYFPLMQNVPVTYTVEGLPRGSGLSLDFNSGFLHGTPTGVDVAASGSAGFSLTVNVHCGGMGTSITKSLMVRVQGQTQQCNPCEANGGKGSCEHICYIANNEACVSACACPPGFSLNSDQRTCSNNPCNYNNGQCSHICTDVGGAARCVCPPGLNLDVDGRTCRQFTCPPGACQFNCVSANGQSICQCPAGMTLNIDGRTCSANDPCLSANGGCAHRCTNSNGRATCDCFPGFTLGSDMKSCSQPTQIDPCTRSNGGCEQQCFNNNGVATCSCSFGNLALDGRSCNINACAIRNGGCEQTCTNTNGRAVCSCYNGMLAPDGTTCQDACSVNNGGCQQICIAAGTHATCDCRVGVLGADGRTCATELLVVGTIPPGLVIGCQSFVFDFSTAFRYSGKNPERLTFTLSGLTQGTGFSMTPTGLLTGTPTQADCSRPQPMSLTVTATDGSTARAQAVMFLSSFCSVGVCQKATTTQVTQTNSAIPLLWAMVGVEFRFDVAKFFSGFQVPLVYRLAGLPAMSGLRMTQEGVIVGIPSVVDCQSSPLGLTVIAQDTQARQYKAIIYIKFRSCGNQIGGTIPSVTPPVLPMPVPTGIATTATNLHVHTSATYGQPFFYDVAKHFKVNSLMFRIEGLPTGSGFRLTPTGTITGAANENDCRAISPIRAIVVGTDQFGASVTIVVNIDMVCPSVGLPTGPVDPRPTSNSGTLVPVQTAFFGQQFFLDVSQVSMCQCSGPVQYQLMGLPVGSGLRITANGQISGTPSAADCSAQQPLQLRVFAVQHGQQQGNGLVRINVQCYNNGNSAPVLNGALPSSSASVGELFYFDSSQHFNDPDGDQLTYSIQGLPQSTNLRISPSTGVFSGVPNSADLNAGPFLITAVDPKGSIAQGTLGVNMMFRSATNHAPIFVPAHPIDAFEGKFLVFDVSERFQDEDGDALTFKMESDFRGLNLDAETGILGGVPTVEDAALPQPVRVKIMARDTSGARTKGVLEINIRDRNGQINTKQQVFEESLAEDNSPPVATKIKAQVSTQGKPFVLGVASNFFDADGDLLTFSIRINDLARGSGIKIDPTSGVISGTPSTLAANQVQPLQITVTASDRHGGQASETLFLTVFKGRFPDNHSPVTSGIPPAEAFVGNPCVFSFAKRFSDPDGDKLLYSVDGLPEGSGLFVKSNIGVIGGRPTPADALASPLMLVIRATDKKDGVVEAVFTITIKQAQVRANTKPVSKKMPHATVGTTEPFMFDVSNYFSDADGDKLTFKVFGLPHESGLSLNSQGKLSGRVSTADLNAKQPIIAGIVADDGKGGKVGEILYLTVASAQKAGKQDQGIDLASVTFMRSAQDFHEDANVDDAAPVVSFVTDSWGFFRVSRYFPSYTEGVKVLYSIRGLDGFESGLTMDSESGVLSGTPVMTEALSEALSLYDNLLPVTVVAKFRYDTREAAGNDVEQLILIKFVSASQNQLNHAPLARSIPSVKVAINSEILHDTSGSFSDPDEDDLTFSIEGVPEGTGFSIVPSSGVIFGSPSMADIQSKQPMLVSVIASDGKGGKTQETMFIHVVKSPTIAAPEISAGVDKQVVAATSGLPEVSSRRSCETLGWATELGAKVCATVPRTKDGQCPPLMNYKQAEDLCLTNGARLCTSAELSTLTGQDEFCQSDNARVFTSNVCAFDNQVLTQPGLGKNLVNNPKKCSSKADKMRVKCCADASATARIPEIEQQAPAMLTQTQFSPSQPQVEQPQPRSTMSCDVLNWPVNPTSTNTKVCATSQVQPQTPTKCSRATNFASAKSLCSKLGARVCTAEELDQGVAVGTGCGADNKRVWTSTACPLSGQVMTQAGDPSLLKDIGKECSSISENFQVRCCADFKDGDSFELLDTLSAKGSVTLRVKYSAFNKITASYRPLNPILRSSNDKVRWVTPSKTRNVILSNSGEATIQFSGLKPAWEYEVRVTPLYSARSEQRPKQSVIILVKTA